MKPYKKTFQDYWMFTDIKPRGRTKRMVTQQTRARLKKDLEKKIKEMDEEECQTITDTIKKRRSNKAGT